jgi:FMN phosphatase YigB (HAD superfamily)
MVRFLTWISIKAFIKKISAWCKKYWQILVGAAVPIVLMLVFRKKGDLEKILNRARDDYEKEINVINSAHNKELEDREAARKLYAESIKEIEKRYTESKQTLDRNKKKEIEKIILENSNNPDEITRRIAEITGFEIY